MADPMDLWRLTWSTAITGALDRIADSLPRPDAVIAPVPAETVDLSGFPVMGRVRLELATMRLLEQREPASPRASPILIVAPYAVHDASIADLARGHSIAQTLAGAGSGYIALTFWKSATVEMRDYGIDAYLSDLNVAVDEFGGRASLVGLCQGGWLAAAYAARFPHKVAKLVLAGAPIDPGAGESGITKTLASVSPATISQLIAFSGGRVLGAVSSALWSEANAPEFNAEAALQGEEDAAIVERFDAWNARIVDLPGVYFLQTSEWVFRERRLARGAFPALGRLIRLEDIDCPIFVVAAADDEIVTLPQTLAVKRLCPRARVEIRVAPGRHLSQFMGRKTLGSVWPEVAQWLKPKTAPRRRGREKNSPPRAASC
ncbi:MAG TPA: alpha/beta fold hydrolase [Roseiarcus sp.]|nr:alpha/beta fold hydrolase [Roseiarcus sp.]